VADAYWVQQPGVQEPGREPGVDDGWGPSRSVRSASADEPAPRPRGRRRRPAGEPAPKTLDVDAYAGSPWGPSTASNTAGYAEDPFARPDRYAVPEARADRASASQSALNRLRAAVPATQQRGLPGWGALLVQIGVTVIGILVDALRGQQLGTGFNVGIIAGAVLSILLVRRSSMFPVVVAPPIVYSLAAGVSLYIRSSGLSDHSVLLDAATNWLVYGFPAIAAATAAVLIIAGIRLIVRR
jgi:hypothetical protein